MNKRGIFPTKDADRNTYFNVVVLYLIANAKRLKISDEDLAQLPLLLSDWNDWYVQAQNDNLRNKQIVANKDAASEELTAMLRRVYGDIPQSVLSIDDRNTLNMEERSTTKTPSPVPVTFPIATVKYSVRL
jgi:hypothetical protein